MIKNELFKNKKILITGGTGTFGKACTKYLLENTKVRKIYIFSRDEQKQFKFKNEISENDFQRISFLIGDIRDKERLIRAFNGINYVIHSAAQKHVPSCEYNPFEAVKTNIIGAENIINSAIDNNVEKVIALSTDKAVEPINLYGATKCVMEKLFIQGNNYSAGKTKFSVTRYGNVIASRGSVLPLWHKNVEEGKHIYLTDKRMTRFVISIEDAILFVLKSLLNMSGSEIFIPKLKSINMFETAKLVSNKIKISGIRQGEKLHETLISRLENNDIYEFNNTFVIVPKCNKEYKKLKKIEGIEYNSKDNKFINENEIKNIWRNIENE